MKKIFMISFLAVILIYSPKSYSKELDAEIDERQQIEQSFDKSNEEDIRFSLDASYSLPPPHNTSITLWHFQITTPSKQDNYPLPSMWYSDELFLGSTLPLLYGNKIVIMKKRQSITTSFE